MKWTTPNSRTRSTSSTWKVLLTLAGLHLSALICCAAGDAQKKPTPFISEIAPGVFVRDLDGIYGSNQIFIEFKDYVVVFDPSVAAQGGLLENEIRARTAKPVRFVVQSHFHPDHTLGAAVFARAGGVEILAGADDRESYENWAREDFKKKKAAAPEVYEGLEYPAPTRYLTAPEIFDDGEQRLEVIPFGHGHTKGDLVGWLPKQGILLTGDACENGAFNNLANANVASWVHVLDTLSALPVKIIVPGHGHVAGPELLEMTRQFLIELRRHVKDMVNRGSTYEEVLRAVSVPFYEAKTGAPIRTGPKGVETVFQEVGGKLPKSEEKHPFLSRKKKIAIALAGFIAVAVGLGVVLRKRLVAR